MLETDFLNSYENLNPLSLELRDKLAKLDLRYDDHFRLIQAGFKHSDPSKDDIWVISNDPCTSQIAEYEVVVTTDWPTALQKMKEMFSAGSKVSLRRLDINQNQFDLIVASDRAVVEFIAYYLLDVISNTFFCPATPASSLTPARNGKKASYHCFHYQMKDAVLAGEFGSLDTFKKKTAPRWGMK